MRPLTEHQKRLVYSITIPLIVFLLAYLFWGYTKITLPKDSYSAVFVNGQHIGNDVSSLKLRPGTYTIKIVSPAHADRTLRIKASPFSHKTFGPSTSIPNYTSAAESASGLGGGAFSYNYNKLFDGVWSAGIINIPDQTSYFVMKFENGRWDSVYVGDGTDADFAISVPPDVLRYLVSLPTTGIGGSNGN